MRLLDRPKYCCGADAKAHEGIGAREASGHQTNNQDLLFPRISEESQTCRPSGFGMGFRFLKQAVVPRLSKLPVRGNAGEYEKKAPAFTRCAADNSTSLAGAEAREPYWQNFILGLNLRIN